MDITYNKVDQTALPIDTTRVSASEYNQIAGSLMNIITSAGLTPDSADNTQLLNALKVIGSGWAMPSSTLLVLNIASSGAVYDIPTNGYIYIRATSNNNTSYHSITLHLSDTTDLTKPTSRASNDSNSALLTLFEPVRKGQKFVLEYSGVAVNNIVFVYAEGSKSEAN